eukprot:TRINITY_DN9077_c0_g1_i1.p1 TRINITY_DN9077_c0_g1~~TRINITY_DN9077_c0_g1_i1.p1  ORF type:complete len:159 (-),score=10.07 TRINITY_DN9077_c0_g1_i1:51-527(-)
MEKRAVSRLQKELRALEKENSNDVILLLENEDLFHWKAFIQGGVDTPYEGGYFKLQIEVSEDYPIKPPAVKFITPVFHPNVHFKTGEICIDLLKDAWLPSYTLQSICRSIINLLAHPEPDSPLNCDCGNLLRGGDTRGYNSMARMYTRLFAEFNEPRA